MVIDCHCHAGSAGLLTAPWTTDAPLDVHLERAAAAGIDRTVIFPIECEDYPVANRMTASITAEFPGQLIGFARIHPARDAGTIADQVKQCREEYGLRGIKVHGAECMPTRELMEAAAKYRMPVLVDTKGQSLPVDMAAGAYPEVNIIIAHLGSFDGVIEAHQAAIDLMIRHANVYADSSSVRFFDYLQQAVQRAGAGKLLFGSDGPLLHPGVEKNKLDLLDLKDDERDAVMGQNLSRLLPPG